MIMMFILDLVGCGSYLICIEAKYNEIIMYTTSIDVMDIEEICHAKNNYM